MTTFGVSPDGFTAPTEADLRAQIEADQRANIAQTLDLSNDSVIGQINRGFAQRLAAGWAALGAINDGNDPDRAEDDQLVSVAKLTDTDKRGASKSTVVLKVALAEGTVLEAGVHFAAVLGKEDVRFTPQEDFTADAAADYKLDFEAETTGPTKAAAGTITVIATPVIGWLSVVNEDDATVGRNADGNPELRIRREQGLQRPGSSTTEALRADVLAVNNVTSCQVFENWTDITDPATGLPSKSFEVVLWDDAGADDDAVAQAIGTSKAGGIQPYGAESGTALDADGNPKTMYFSRASAALMYVTIKVTPREGYVGDAAFKLAVASALNAELGTGDDVAEWDISDAGHGLGAKLSGIKFGIAPAPTNTDDYPIGTREIARFDSGRITLT